MLVLIQNGYIAWYIIDQEEFGFDADLDYEHEDDDDYGESVRSRYEENNNTSWLSVVGESLMGLGQAFDFTGAGAIAKMQQ